MSFLLYYGSASPNYLYSISVIRMLYNKYSEFTRFLPNLASDFVRKFVFLKHSLLLAPRQNHIFIEKFTRQIRNNISWKYMKINHMNEVMHMFSTYFEICCEFSNFNIFPQHRFLQFCSL